MSWRDLLFGRRRRPAAGTALALAADRWERAGQASPVVMPIMAEVEATALKVYADHGLPTLPGHYRRGPRDQTWTFLSEHLDAEARWAMVLDKPLEDGWRYATLDDIGRFPGASIELRAASRLLGECRRLKARLAGKEHGSPWDDVETAIRLGVEWRALQDAMAWGETTRLKLTTPSDVLDAPEAGPRPKRVRRRKSA